MFSFLKYFFYDMLQKINMVCCSINLPKSCLFPHKNFLFFAVSSPEGLNKRLHLLKLLKIDFLLYGEIRDRINNSFSNIKRRLDFSLYVLVSFCCDVCIFCMYVFYFYFLWRITHLLT